MNRLDEITALASEGNATYLRPYDDDRILVNMPVWEDLESLRPYVYGTAGQRALWWVPAGNIPGIDEARKRLAYLEAHGLTEFAFNFKTTFAPAERFQQSVVELSSEGAS